MNNTKIQLYNRKSKTVEEEDIFAKRYMESAYSSAFGRLLAGLLASDRLFSRFYGYMQSRPESVAKINAFIRQYHVDMRDIDVPSTGFHSFNDFFIRKMLPAARPVMSAPNLLIAPADSRLLASPIGLDTVFVIKGVCFTLAELVPDYNNIADYTGGLCLIFRLAPMDCHRFYFIDDGYQEEVIPVGGMLYSVSPLAVRYKSDTLQKNYRQFCVLRTRNFGAVLQIEVGALAVGTICQHMERGGNMTRGQEKGYFAFGGSTIVMLFKPDTVIVDDDITKYSHRGIETMVHYGSAIGRKAERGGQ